MITLRTLQWSNCFSYGENNSLDLSDEKITQILGTNGVGKSSIPLILEEVLFNKNSKGIKKADIPNRLLDKGYSINLTFTKDSDTYEIDLVRKSTLKVKLLKNGEDISSHTATNTYKNIEEIIGIDFKTFSQVVYQNTNASLNFLTATDANRKKFLIDLLGLEKYIEIFEIFKAVSRDVESEYARIEGKISTIEKWLETNKLTDTIPQGMLELPKISEDNQTQLSSLMVDLQNISTTNRKISTNNKYKEMLKSINLIEVQSIEADKLESYDKQQTELGVHLSTVNTSKQMLRKYRALTNECPNCGQHISDEFIEQHVAEHETSIKEAEELIKQLENDIATIKENNRLYSYKQTKMKEWEDLYTNIDQDLPTQLLNEENLRERVNALKAEISSIQTKISSVEAENQKRSAHNARIEVISEQTKSFEEQLGELDNSFGNIQKKKNYLEILKKAFSTNGLIAYKIENLVKELEDLTNAYLSELSDGRFTLNFAVNNDKLNVEITDNGNIVDILALSSGELARVNTSTLLGIRRLMNSLSSSQINVLFLDEVMNVLDEQGREKLVEVLMEEHLNTYIVSHQWSHPLLEKMEIQKIDGVSSIVW